MRDLQDRAERAPRKWKQPCTVSETKLHQLSPYIGKLKSSIAADLIREYTLPDDIVVDPFCGSGTIPLEAALAGRTVVASDASSYAMVLTRAKLRPPASLEAACIRLAEVLRAADARRTPQLAEVPRWVRRFFHPRTLGDSIRFADECIARKDYFLLACFLGILHHQRAGFLSFPSSHLVPYLRERNFPRDRFPELYAYRALAPRMQKKITRALSDPEALARVRGTQVMLKSSSVERFRGPHEVDAIVTSPPYMNALDYRRDNRLRLWFLERSTEDYSPEPTDRRELFDQMIRALTTKLVSRLRYGGHCILVVGETVRRKDVTRHPAETILAAVGQQCPSLRLVKVLEDVIPDVRRSRRGHRATKKELILVFRKTRRGRLRHAGESVH
jgi:hypothetical protein